MEQTKKEIENKINSVSGKMVKLGDIALKISNSINPQEHSGMINYIGLENIESNTGSLVGNIQTDYQEIKSSKTIFQIGDILYGKLRPNLNKVYLAKENGICSTDILVFRFENEYLTKFYSQNFLGQNFNREVLKGVSGVQLPRTSWENMSQIKIPFPSLETQKQIVSKIEVMESKISEAKKVIDGAKEQIETILRSYL